MAVPVLEFHIGEWLDIPPRSGFIALSVDARVPVAVSLGVAIFSKPTGDNLNWSLLGKRVVDNLAETPAQQKLELVVDPRRDYMLRFQGEAHVLLPGEKGIELSIAIEAQNGPITDFNGKKKSEKARAVGINGSAFLRQKKN